MISLMSLTEDHFKPLSVNSQIKKVGLLIDKAIAETNRKLDESEKERNDGLREMGNLLHSSVPVSINEVLMHYSIFFNLMKNMLITQAENAVEWTFGDCISLEKYSHVDLIRILEGVDVKRGAATAGGRGYQLLGPMVFLEQVYFL